MKKIFSTICFVIFFAALSSESALAQNDLGAITRPVDTFGEKPIPVALSGFTGEGAEVLKFDLTVQGFSFVTPDAAQYLISGSDAGAVTGSLTDKFAKRVLLSRSYNGASLRRQAHAFADDIVFAITGKKGIGQTKIAYKSQPAGYGVGEIYVSDFDGANAQRITTDNAIVAKPAWAPGKLALYYTSYALDNPDIFYHSLSNGQRRKIAAYSGLNTSAAVSPDGSKLAMVLSKSGSANIWVCSADGTNLKQITHGAEDSSPTWSPDGSWICFATKHNERRRLAKIPSGGGTVQYLNTTGAANPTEPDWSPDGKWIAFTSQMGDFNICVVPADGSASPAVLASGQNPSWSPNSRTLAYNRSLGYRQELSVLDVFTKQYKDCARAGGSNSQPAWAK
jgi:TolB protein